MMKKTTCIVVILAVLAACNNQPIKKPDNLIDENQMTEIFYDLTIIDAMKSQSPGDIGVQSIKPKDFIYKKYHIDSVQFANSNKYYISQIETYKKMFEKINARIEAEKFEADEVVRSGESPAPAK